MGKSSEHLAGGDALASVALATDRGGHPWTMPLPGSVVYPAAVLRVTPDVLPELRRTIDNTLNELSPRLRRMAREGFLPEPWLGDPSAASRTWSTTRTS